MFVRLFVDENLDRNVPISRQPKEKIQAIVDSCTRQFPEHAPRARKRIQMYLKSCRKNKRTREQAGIDSTSVSTIFLLKHTWIEYSNVTTPKNILSRDLPFFPFQNRATPLQMNSVQCEQMLARACENESENAKRMRMGMEPVSQPMPASGPVSLSTSVVDSLSSIPNAVSTTTSFGSTTMMKQPKTEYKPGATRQPVAGRGGLAADVNGRHIIIDVEQQPIAKFFTIQRHSRRSNHDLFATFVVILSSDFRNEWDRNGSGTLQTKPATGQQWAGISGVYHPTEPDPTKWKW